jgi:hypothetical protein
MTINVGDEVTSKAGKCKTVKFYHPHGTAFLKDSLQRVTQIKTA